MSITKHIGDLTITKANAKNFEKLEEVTGYLYIEHKASLPVLTSVGGDLSITFGLTFDYSAIKFDAGEVLAVWEYALHHKDGLFRAGCRGPWTAEQALEHWDAGHHAPSRAELFRATIQALEFAA